MQVSDYDVAINANYAISSQAQLIAQDEDFRRDGYMILAWTEKADGSGRRYTLEETLQASEVSGDLSFYAQWGKIEKLFYFESQEEGATIAFEKVGSPWEANFLSSSDGENWNEYAVGTTYSFPSIGSRFYLKRADGVNTGLLSKSTSRYYYFAMSKKIAAYGNIQWLLDRTGQSLSCSDSCYHGMFYGCASLTQAPELQASALAENCYESMFLYCASLAQAPALPATALADRCYRSMFHSCTSLTQAPALSATELAPYCYYYMFYNCASLSVNENVEEGSLVLSVASGTAKPTAWSEAMFTNTAGRFRGTPKIGNVYRCYGQTQFDPEDTDVKDKGTGQVLPNVTMLLAKPNTVLYAADGALLRK